MWRPDKRHSMERCALPSVKAEPCLPNSAVPLLGVCAPASAAPADTPAANWTNCLRVSPATPLSRLFAILSMLHRSCESYRVHTIMNAARKSACATCLASTGGVARSWKRLGGSRHVEAGAFGIPMVFGVVAGLRQPVISGDEKADAGARKFKANVHYFGREIGGWIVGFAFTKC